MGYGGGESVEMKFSPFSGGSGVESVFLGFWLSDMVDIRIVRYIT